MSLLERVNRLVSLGAGDANENESARAAVFACRLIKEHGFRITDQPDGAGAPPPVVPTPPSGSPLMDLFKRAADVGGDILRDAILSEQHERARRRVEDAIDERELSAFAYDLAQAPVSAAREARRAASGARPSGVSALEAQFVRAYFRLEHEVLSIAADLYRRAGQDAKADKLEHELESQTRAECMMQRKRSGSSRERPQ